MEGTAGQKTLSSVGNILERGLLLGDQQGPGERQGGLRLPCPFDCSLLGESLSPLRSCPLPVLPLPCLSPSSAIQSRGVQGWDQAPGCWLEVFLFFSFMNIHSMCCVYMCLSGRVCAHGVYMHLCMCERRQLTEGWPWQLLPRIVCSSGTRHLLHPCPKLLSVISQNPHSHPEK